MFGTPVTGEPGSPVSMSGEGTQQDPYVLTVPAGQDGGLAPLQVNRRTDTDTELLALHYVAPVLTLVVPADLAAFSAVDAAQPTVVTATDASATPSVWSGNGSISPIDAVSSTSLEDLPDASYTYGLELTTPGARLSGMPRYELHTRQLLWHGKLVAQADVGVTAWANPSSYGMSPFRPRAASVWSGSDSSYRRASATLNEVAVDFPQRQLPGFSVTASGVSLPDATELPLVLTVNHEVWTLDGPTWIIRDFGDGNEYAIPIPTTSSQIVSLDAVGRITEAVSAVATIATDGTITVPPVTLAPCNVPVEFDSATKTLYYRSSTALANTEKAVLLVSRVVALALGGGA